MDGGSDDEVGLRLVQRLIVSLDGMVLIAMVVGIVFDGGKRLHEVVFDEMLVNILGAEDGLKMFVEGLLGIDSQVQVKGNSEGNVNLVNHIHRHQIAPRDRFQYGKGLLKLPKTEDDFLVVLVQNHMGKGGLP